MISPFVQIVARLHVLVVRSHERVAQRGLDTSHAGHLRGPARVVRRVHVGQNVEPPGRDVWPSGTLARAGELSYASGGVTKRRAALQQASTPLGEGDVSE